MKIDISKSAGLALRKSNKRTLITKKIMQLAEKPDSLSANIKKMKGRDESRLRVQNWRIIYRVQDDILHIDEIESRGSVYRN